MLFSVSTNTEQEVYAIKRSRTRSLTLRENEKETIVTNHITESIQNTSNLIDSNIESKTNLSCNGKNTTNETLNKNNNEDKSTNNEELGSSIGELDKNLKTKTTSKLPENSKIAISVEAESNINKW